MLADIDEGRPVLPEELEEEVVEQIDISIKYDGYISRQKKQVEQFKKLENKKIPEDIDYDLVKRSAIRSLTEIKRVIVPLP